MSVDKNCFVCNITPCNCPLPSHKIELILESIIEDINHPSTKPTMYRYTSPDLKEPIDIPESQVKNSYADHYKKVFEILNHKYSAKYIAWPTRENLSKSPMPELGRKGVYHPYKKIEPEVKPAKKEETWRDREPLL